MSHVDAMAVAAEASSVSITKPSDKFFMASKPEVSHTPGADQQSLTLPIIDSPTPEFSCVEPNSEKNVFCPMRSCNQMQQLNVPSSSSNLCENVTYGHSNFSPISAVESEQDAESPSIDSSSRIRESHLATTEATPVSASSFHCPAQKLQYSPPRQTTFSANEFKKKDHRKRSLLESSLFSTEDSQPSAKPEDMEDCSIITDWNKRSRDLKKLRDMFPAVSFGLLDSIYMKAGCNRDRAVAALKRKAEEYEKKKQKDLEEWRKACDCDRRKKLLEEAKRPRLNLGPKLDLGPKQHCVSADKSKPLPPPEKVISVLDLDAGKSYRCSFSSFDPPDASARINAFMQQNVVQTPAHRATPAEAQTNRKRSKTRPTERNEVLLSVRRTTDPPAANPITAATDTTLPPSIASSARNESFQKAKEKMKTPQKMTRKIMLTPSKKMKERNELNLNVRKQQFLSESRQTTPSTDALTDDHRIQGHHRLKGILDVINLHTDSENDCPDNSELLSDMPSAQRKRTASSLSEEYHKAKMAFLRKEHEAKMAVLEQELATKRLEHQQKLKEMKLMSRLMNEDV